MKILFDNKIFINQTNGGPSIYFINLINELKKLNGETKISSLLHASNMLNESKIQDKGSKLPFNSQLLKYNFTKKCLHRLNNYFCNYKLNNFQPDIYHTTYYENYKYPTDKKIQKIVTVFDLINEKFNNTFYRNKTYLNKKEILNFADKIICISESTKNDLLKYYNIEEKKISVVYLGYPEKINYLKKIFNLPYILFVGTRWKYKNFNKLLKAISISKFIKNNFQLVAFGGGKFNNYEKSLIKKYDLKNIIQIDGNNEKLYSCYKYASMFVYPTQYEGFGLPILESFLYECPVACSHNSSLPEVAGEAAVYFDSNDEKDISKKIETVLLSKSLKKNLNEKAIIQLKKFSWSKCAQQTLNIYKS
jgi:glycosyltransferase involved in cell wall biosynthesis